MMEKLPPIEKIYEAYSALADERAVLKDDHGEVHSSDMSKCYTVTFAGDTYACNDNATYWQGYAGYPVIAVLFLQGKLEYNPDIVRMFKGICWNKLNKEHKRDYQAAVQEVMKERGLESEKIMAETAEVYEALKKLDIHIRRGKLRPPK